MFTRWIERLEELLRQARSVELLSSLRDRTEERRHSYRHDLPPCEEAESLEQLIEAGRTFGTIYVDPAWPYRKTIGRAASSAHYVSMSMESIEALPIKDLAAPDSHLWLWVCNAFLLEVRPLFEAWGFDYKTALVWVKPELGCGNYLRNATELCLFGTRGRPGFGRKDQPSWICASRTKHSEKPEIVRELIEQCSPAPRLEVFARRRSPSWTIVGNQVEPPTLFDVGEDDRK